MKLRKKGEDKLERMFEQMRDKNCFPHFENNKKSKRKYFKYIRLCNRLEL